MKAIVIDVSLGYEYVHTNMQPRRNFSKYCFYGSFYPVYQDEVLNFPKTKCRRYPGQILMKKYRTFQLNYQNMSDVTYDTLLSILPYYCIKLYKISITSVNLLCQFVFFVLLLHFGQSLTIKIANVLCRMLCMSNLGLKVFSLQRLNVL